MSPVKKILLVGGSGFLGNEIGIELVKAGYQVNLLSRTKKSSGLLSFPVSQYIWQEDGTVPEAAIAGVEAIINLAGESISQGRWTAAKRRKIIDSRFETTTRIVNAAKKHQIETLIQASAIGYYGDTGSSSADESAPLGRGFLAETAKQWEAPLAAAGPGRRIIMRIGVVLGTTGGALPEILNPYVAGLGAPIGKGKHYISWIHVKDICRFVIEALGNPDLKGVYNLTAPQPVSYQQLHEELKARFGGLSFIRVPPLALKIALGEKAQLILLSQRVLPKNLAKSGFEFAFPSLESALADLLGSENSDCAVVNRKQWIPADKHRVWQFFSTEKNLEKLTPAFLKFKVNSISTPVVQEASLINYSLKIHGLPAKWRSKIINFQPENSFRDIQLKGPYRTWDHTHKFTELGGGTLVQDFVRYKVPLGVVGGVLVLPFVKKDIEQIFHYRKTKVAEIFSKEEKH